MRKMSGKLAVWMLGVTAMLIFASPTMAGTVWDIGNPGTAYWDDSDFCPTGSSGCDSDYDVADSTDKLPWVINQVTPAVNIHFALTAAESQGYYDLYIVPQDIGYGASFQVLINGKQVGHYSLPSPSNGGAWHNQRVYEILLHDNLKEGDNVVTLQNVADGNIAWDYLALKELVSPPWQIGIEDNSSSEFNYSSSQPWSEYGPPARLDYYVGDPANKFNPRISWSPEQRRLSIHFGLTEAESQQDYNLHLDSYQAGYAQLNGPITYFIIMVNGNLIQQPGIPTPPFSWDPITYNYAPFDVAIGYENLQAGHNVISLVLVSGWFIDWDYIALTCTTGCPSLEEACVEIGDAVDAAVGSPAGYKNHGQYVSAVAKAASAGLANYGCCFDTASLDEIHSCVVSARAKKR